MSNTRDFKRIVAGSGIYSNVPPEWAEYGYDGQFRHIDPVSAVAQIAIERARDMEHLEAKKPNLDLPYPIPNLYGDKDHDSGIATMVRQRRQLSQEMEIASDFQQVFRMQYYGIYSALRDNAQTAPPDQRYLEAVGQGSSNTIGLVNRIFYHERKVIPRLVDSVVELKLFYELEEGLHFQGLVAQSQEI